MLIYNFSPYHLIKSLVTTIIDFSRKLDDALFKTIQKDIKYSKNDTDLEVNEIH